MIDYLNCIYYKIHSIFQDRTAFYIAATLIVFAGIRLLFHSPTPFGYRDPLGLFRNTFETFTKDDKNGKIL